MSECSKAPSRVGQGRGACRANDFGQTNPSGFWPGTFAVLNRSFASRLKNPLYFPVVYREAYFATRCSCIHAPGLMITQVEPDANLAERTQPDFGGGQRAGRTGLSRDSARIVISATVEGLRHNDFSHFPQTKPISANEANIEKTNETMLQDEQHAPLRSGARTRLLCACSGASGSAFCQPVQIDDEGSL